MAKADEFGDIGWGRVARRDSHDIGGADEGIDR